MQENIPWDGFMSELWRASVLCAHFCPGALDQCPCTPWSVLCLLQLPLCAQKLPYRRLAVLFQQRFIGFLALLLFPGGSARAME